MSSIETIIQEHQRGLLYRDGRLTRWLEPGRHRYWAWRADWKIVLLDLEQCFAPSTPELRAILPEEAGFEVTIEEHEVGVLLVDGAPRRALEAGRYILWQQRHDVRVRVHDMRERFALLPQQHANLLRHLMTTVTLRESQRGVVLEDGVMSAWLEPGRHDLWSYDREVTVRTLDIDAGFLAIDHMPEIARVLPQAAAAPLEVGVGEVAMLYREGRAFTCLTPGSYLVWKLDRNITFGVFSTQPLMTEIPEREWALVPAHIMTAHTVRPHERGLLWVNGAFEQELKEGRYGVHRDRRDVAFCLLDMREQEIQIQGQEVMTSDKVTLRLNLVVKWRIAEARKSMETQTSIHDALYSEAQLVARAYIASVSIDALLEGRNAAAEAMRAELAPRAATWGLELARIDLKDVILPGEMKSLLNRVIEAQKQADANVIMRREETSATRAQANTAKMMENNPALMRMKELELMSEISHNVGTITIVTGGEDIMRALSAPRLGQS